MKLIFQGGGGLVTKSAKDYISRMQSAIGDRLINPDSIYSVRTGHERFAKECGYALNDFCKEDQNELLSSTYSTLYVRGTFLHPILDANEWIRFMKSQIKEKFS